MGGQRVPLDGIFRKKKFFLNQKIIRYHQTTIAQHDAKFHRNFDLLTGNSRCYRMETNVTSTFWTSLNTKLPHSISFRGGALQYTYALCILHSGLEFWFVVSSIVTSDARLSQELKYSGAWSRSVLAAVSLLMTSRFASFCVCGKGKCPKKYRLPLNTNVCLYTGKFAIS